MSVQTTSVLTTAQSNQFGFLTSAGFWINCFIVLLVVMCAYLLYNIVISGQASANNQQPVSSGLPTAYGDFFNGISGFIFNGASASFAISYPVLSNKQIGAQISSSDNTTIIYLGFNEISGLIDTISNSYYDPSLQTITSISQVLAQTKLTLPTRAIVNNAISDTTSGSYAIWFSLDVNANMVMNITSSTTPVSGSNVSITPLLK